MTVAEFKAWWEGFMVGRRGMLSREEVEVVEKKIAELMEVDAGPVILSFPGYFHYSSYVPQTPIYPWQPPFRWETVCNT